MTQTTPEIVLDGVSYSLSNFSQNVQAMVNVRQRWEGELAEERSKVLKTEQAMRALDAELTALVQKELADKAEAAKVAEAGKEAAND